MATRNKHCEKCVCVGFESATVRLPVQAISFAVSSPAR